MAAENAAQGGASGASLGGSIDARDRVVVATAALLFLAVAFAGPEELQAQADASAQAAAPARGEAGLAGFQDTLPAFALQREGAGSDLKAFLAVLPDPSGELRVSDVVRGAGQDHWLTPGDEGIRSWWGRPVELLSERIETAWFLVRLAPAADSGPQRLVYPGVFAEHLEVYQLQDGDAVLLDRAGRKNPVRPLQGPECKPSFALNPPAGDAVRDIWLLMRVEAFHGELTNRAWQVWSAEAWTEQSAFESLLHLAVGLVLAALALYHLVSFLPSRDVCTLLVGLFMLSLAWIDMATSGALQGVLLHGSPVRPGLHGWLCLVWIGMAAGGEFTIRMMHGRQVAPRASALSTGLNLLLLLNVLCAIFVPLAASMVVAVVLVTLNALGPSGVVMYAGWRAGRWPQRFLILGLCCMVAGSGVYIAGALNHSTTMPLWMELSLGWGLIGMALWFSLALGERARLDRRIREVAQSAAFEAQERALVLQREAAATLQEKVNERTAELAEEKAESDRQHSVAEEARARAEREYGHATEARGEAEFARSQAEFARLQAETSRKDADEARARVEEMDQQKTRFFQNMSHELRTPLTLVLSPLARSLQLHPEDENLSVAQRNARRLLRLVNQLLDFQKLRAGKLELKLAPLELVAFSRLTVACFLPTCRARESTLTVTVEGEPLTDEAPEVFVRSEVDALEKIVFNYLSNAIKYVPRGGHICLDIREAEGHIRLSVQDDGPGIAVADQDRLFQVFSQIDGSATREHEGTGLGLALVRQLAEAMGGSVGVDSAPGEGSTFWLELPCLDAARARTEGTTCLADFEARSWLLADSEERQHTLPPLQAPSSEPAASLGRILVVDDLPDMRDLVASTLRAQGYHVEVADRGDHGLEAARMLRPDLVVSDWMMPVMSGPDMVAHMRQDGALKHTPVILLTAKSDAENKVKATLAGADAFLGKPFDEAELCAEVRNLLALKAREREVEVLNRKLVEQGLSRCLPPALLEGVLKGDLEVVQTPKLECVTVLSARLAGFEQRMRALSPSISGQLLDDYLGVVGATAFASHGTLVHFSGDRIDVLFGAPEPMLEMEAIQAALHCALQMHEAVREMSAAWQREGLEPAELCVGVHGGEALVGTFGSEVRAEYTAIGPTVTLAEKLAQVAAPGSVTLCANFARGLPGEALKGAGQLMLQGDSEALKLVSLTPRAPALLGPAPHFARTG